VAKPFAGTSSQTKKGLIESGAMVKEDFEESAPKRAEPIKPQVGKMIPESEAQKLRAKAKATTDKGWLKSKQKGKK